MVVLVDKVAYGHTLKARRDDGNSERKIEKARSGRVTAKDVRGDRQPKTQRYRLKDGTPKALARLPDGVDVAVVPRSKAAETKLNGFFRTAVSRVTATCSRPLASSLSASPGPG